MYRAWPVLMFAAHRFSLVTVNSQWAAENFVRKYQNNDAVMCQPNFEEAVIVWQRIIPN